MVPGGAYRRPTPAPKLLAPLGMLLTIRIPAHALKGFRIWKAISNWPSVGKGPKTWPDHLKGKTAQPFVKNLPGTQKVPRVLPQLQATRASNSPDHCALLLVNGQAVSSTWWCTLGATPAPTREAAATDKWTSARSARSLYSRS
jgi:hypothetical protein